MAAAPESLEALIEALGLLPGVGRRTAERLAHHLLRVPEEEALALADAIREARARIRPCSTCGAPSERDPCAVCADPARDAGLVLVLETARDLRAVEDSGAWRGVYHVLGGRVSPVEGVGPEALALEALRRRAASGAVREVVIGTNPDLEGDGTGLHVARALADVPGVVVTRLARGMPAGGAIEYVSKAVLADALEHRRPTGRASAQDRPG
jgi:recombination protein RecR